MFKAGSTLLLLILAVSRLSAAEVITIAGNGDATFHGDGGPAVDAGVNEPFGLVIGPDGALYVCETKNHVVRRIDETTGKISTVAGSGKKGYAGDGGPATAALLNEPYEIRFDNDGHMFFVEMRNHIVRRVDAKTGRISTVAGNGTEGFSGDGGPATEAQLKVPHSIVLDNAGNLYICDIGNHRVRRVDLSTGVISTFAGTGERSPTPNGARLTGTPLNGPRALDFDGDASLYLALREGNAVYRIDLKEGTLHHIAGTGKKGYAGDGGDARQALLSGPKGVAIGPGGDIYLADTESHTIRVIRAHTNIIETLVGDGQRGDGPDGDPLKCRLDRPHGVFVDPHGTVYIGDSSNNRVRKLPAPKVGWTRIQIDAAFRSEGVAAADINRDGLIDVVAGDVWYEAPDWKMHAIRPVGQFVAGVGYSNSFCNFTYDVNGDGWDDVILIGFPGEPFHWYENPQNKSGHWKEHVIWHSACNETPDFRDVTGDGKPEIVLGSQPESQMGFLTLPAPERAAEKWTFHPISRPGDPMKNGTFKYYHGLGIGDFNNNGRQDVFIPHGWWEAPENPLDESWTFHPFTLSKTGTGDPLRGANMYADDLDLDGDNDIIMSSAHDFGVWWFENRLNEDDGPAFRYHLIDESYSQTHAMHFVDIDGDGTKNIITGKRYFAHNGNDPGGHDPVVMYWYEIKRKRGAMPKFIAHEIIAGRDTGVGTQFLIKDVNGDGLDDVVLSNKKGVNVLLQYRTEETGR